MIFPEAAELNEFLHPDERLIWSGKPKTGLIFRKMDLFIIPFSVIWFGFAIFWVIMAYKSGGAFALVGIPFVLIGFMLVLGRFLLDAKQRKKTIYGMTKERIIIQSGVFSRKIESVDLKTLTNLEFTEKSDGSGSIRLGPKDPRDPFGMMAGISWWPGIKITPGLYEIENVREVYALITRNQR